MFREIDPGSPEGEGEIKSELRKIGLASLARRGAFDPEWHGRLFQINDDWKFIRTSLSWTAIGQFSQEVRMAIAKDTNLWSYNNEFTFEDENELKEFVKLILGKHSKLLQRVRTAV